MFTKVLPFRILSISILFISFSVSIALIDVEAKKIFVGSGPKNNFSNILDAVINATNGDLILLSNETFSGTDNVNIDLTNRNLSIIGSGIDRTIITCDSTRAFYILQQSDSYSESVTYLKISSLTFSACDASQLSPLPFGGSILVLSNQTVLFLDSIAFRSSSAVNGGALYVESFPSPSLGNGSLSFVSSISISNSIFEHGSSSENGAAIYMDGGILLINSTFFLGNNAGGMGGAIFLPENTNFSARNISFLGNQASSDGGALALLGFSNVLCEQCSFIGNQAKESGGGIYSQSSITNVLYCIFSNCSAGNGGAIVAENSASFASVQCLFENNSALELGGAIYTDQDSAFISQKDVLENNQAESEGGALYIGTSSSFTMNSGSILHNSSPLGGAIYLESSSSFDAYLSAIEYNLATKAGGGIYCSNSEVALNTTSLSNNTAPQDSDFYCSYQVAYTYCKVLGNSPFTDICKLASESPDVFTETDIILVAVFSMLGLVLVTYGLACFFFSFDKKRLRLKGLWWNTMNEDSNPAVVELDKMAGQSETSSTEKAQETSLP